MTKPKRYSVAVDDPWFGDGAYITEDGKYVLWEDYAALVAENKRLRKAGDAIVKDNLKWMTNHDHIAAWKAAKEGRDAK